MENLYKLDNLRAVPQLYQKLNLQLSSLRGSLQIFGGVEDGALLGSSTDTEDTAEGSTCDLSFLLVLEVEREIKERKKQNIRIIGSCSLATISNFFVLYCIGIL